MPTENFAELRKRNRELEVRLAEAEEALRALGGGQGTVAAAAAHASVDLRKGITTTARKRREEDLAFLADMSGDFSRLSSPEEIMGTVADKIIAYLDAADCLIAEIDDERDEANVLHSGYAGEMPQVIGVHRLSDYLGEQVRAEAHGGQAVVVHDTRTDPRTANAGYSARQIYSFVAVPLERGGKWKWLLTVNHSAPRAWREEEVGLTREVTSRLFPRLERARAETALRLSEQRFRSLFENSVDAVFITVAGGRVLAANPAACAMFGMTEEELRQVGRAGIVEPGDRVPSEMEEERRRTGRTYGELTLVRKNGTRFPGEVSSAIVSDGGEAFVIVRDITERKRAEETLRASESRERARAAELHAVLEAAPVAVFAAWDPECRFIGGNRMAYDFLRVSEDSNLSWSSASGPAVPSGFRILQSGRELSAADLPLQRAAFNGRAVRGEEFEFVFDDGTRRMLMGDAVPVFGDEGAPRGAVGAFIDVTEGKRTEERLRQMQKLESIGLLAGGIAHDFNNLMTGILGNASIVANDVDDRSAERLRDVIASAERAAGLTRQLLAYSGKGQFIVRDLNVAEAISEIGGLMQVSIPKSVHLSITIETRLPLVRMDPNQFQQLLMNLVINAGEAIGEGRAGNIAIITTTAEIEESFIDTLGQELRPGRYVTIEVSDTGEGMDEAKRALIFDPFFTTKFTGRGLGLAAVAGILRTLKGGITVVSEPGRGSRFRVFLPCNYRVEQSGPQVPADAPTVLVVDEDASIRDLVDFLLGRHGYRVLLASDAREALAVCEREAGPIDLAVVDLLIPLTGAGELLPALEERRPNMSILLTSGYTEPEARRMSGRAAASFLRKPYTAQQILEAVDKLIPAERRQRAVPPPSD